ncbi:MAG: mandelate racemase/muconate lactonizing enzyme family protein [Ectothiorhodospiraceae bacterium]|nr:mandelate racemase/muconate lactonizing enzyme family protein [Chromatiales bacterium]MCP5153700.1 mandelate racemase/muconate lactonizing enzyme family protein [Ectothiorhodospiraceae bacterium]
MRIRDITAYPVSFPIPADKTVSLGIGRAVKRDAVIVRVQTEGGLVGWGESHAGRAPGAVAQLVNTTLRQLALGMEATDVVGIWDRIYRMQLASHGMGAACAIAMSGLDMALWDIRGKAVDWPVWRLLGGHDRPIRAYAGGVSLGHQPPAELVEEAQGVLARGYRALKLRLGDNWNADATRVAAVRAAVGDGVDILTDANAAYTLDDARRVMPTLDDNGVGWLEEPFPPHDHRRYAETRTFGRTPLAAGENHYTRFEFHRLLEDGVVTVVQPDLSKTGGITEGMRIAAMASAWKLRINPHTSLTGLNVAASIHMLCSIDNPGYFEADVSRHNPFRDQLTDWQAEVDADGNVRPPSGPGLGVEIDEAALAAFPVIDGPGYV